MTQELLNILNNKIENVQEGKSFSVKILFGNDWENIFSSKGEKINFGKKFKKKVMEGFFHNVVWIETTNNGRMDVYSKTSTIN